MKYFIFKAAWLILIGLTAQTIQADTMLKTLKIDEGIKMTDEIDQIPMTDIIDDVINMTENKKMVDLLKNFQQSHQDSDDIRVSEESED